MLETATSSGGLLPGTIVVIAWPFYQDAERRVRQAVNGAGRPNRIAGQDRNGEEFIELWAARDGRETLVVIQPQQKELELGGWGIPDAPGNIDCFPSATADVDFRTVWG